MKGFYDDDPNSRDGRWTRPTACPKFHTVVEREMEEVHVGKKKKPKFTE